MPKFIFIDEADRVYSYLKDLKGEFVGLVKRGETRVLDAIPDHRWIEAADGAETAPGPVSGFPVGNSTANAPAASPAVSEPVTAS